MRALVRSTSMQDPSLLHVGDCYILQSPALQPVLPCSGRGTPKEHVGPNSGRSTV